jgi:hypothetical protein
LSYLLIVAQVYASKLDLLNVGLLSVQAIGLLIGMEDLSVDKQATFLSALLVPLCGQV